MFRQALANASRGLRATPRITASRAALQAPSSAAIPSFSLRVSQPLSSRWYSEAKDGTKDAKDSKAEGEAAKTEGAEKNGAKSDADVIAELKKSLETKDAEARDWKDKCLRSIADFRNLQDRTAREVKSARSFAIQGFAKDLVESVDNLDRALQPPPNESKELTPEEKKAQEDLEQYLEGLRMTQRILMQTLAKHGLEQLDPNGDRFNPNEHEAAFMVPKPDAEDNTVFVVVQKGFKLNGRILRAAKVGVVKNA